MHPQPPQHKLQAPPSTRPAWSACRPPVAVAEWWRGWAGGSLFPPGCAADSSLPRFLTSQHLSCPHLAHAAAIYQLPTPAAQVGLSRAAQCLTPLSTSERAARLALLAHRPRGFSPPSSFFSTAAAPFCPPQPYPTLDHNLPVHHSQQTTTTTNHNHLVPRLALSSISPPTPVCSMVPE